VINIFNVDKINKDKGRIKTMREYIGQSLFRTIWPSCPILVLLMDEAHRYRANAGMRARCRVEAGAGFGAVLATPRSTGSKSERFKNVVYDYSLGQAMQDGFVKEQPFCHP